MKKLVILVLCVLFLVSCSSSPASTSNTPITVSPSTSAPQQPYFFLGTWGAPLAVDYGVLIEEFEFREDHTVAYTNALWRTGGMMTEEGTYSVNGSIVTIVLTTTTNHGENGPPSDLPSAPNEENTTPKFVLEIQPNDDESILITLVEGTFFSERKTAGDTIVFYESAKMEEVTDELF